MKINIDEQGSLVLSEVFNGIGIETDAGVFGIAQRDGGIEIMHGENLLLGIYPEAPGLHVRIYSKSAKATGPWQGY